MVKASKKQEFDKKVLPILRDMRVYQMEAWPISRMHTVYATVYKIKLIEEKDFRVHANRENNQIEVTRIK